LRSHGGAADRIGGVYFDELFEDVVPDLLRDGVAVGLCGPRELRRKRAKQRGQRAYGSVAATADQLRGAFDAGGGAFDAGGGAFDAGGGAFGVERTGINSTEKLYWCFSPGCSAPTPTTLRAIFSPCWLLIDTTTQYSHCSPRPA
jgi:hypothetical protein